MTNSNAVSFFILLAFIFFGGFADQAKNVRSENVHRKFRVIGREAIETINALRNVTIRGPTCELELANMITSYLFGMKYILNILNTITPNILNDEALSKLFLDACDQMNEFNYVVQKSVHGDSEKLKDTIITRITAGKEHIKYFAEHLIIPNDFIFNQIDTVANVFLYSFYKLKYRALYFEETNKQLGARINTELVSMPEMLNNFKFNDENAAVEFRHIFVVLEIVAVRLVGKLQTWLEVNPKDTKSTEIITKCLTTYSTIFGKLNSDIVGNHTVEYLKSELNTLFSLGGKAVGSLAEIEYGKNFGGQEFIRSTLFDTLTVSGAFGETIKNYSN